MLQPKKCWKGLKKYLLPNCLERTQVYKGTVKWFNNNKGYGFIRCDKHGEIFVHFSEIQIHGYKTLKEGQAVEYELVNNERGLTAKNVKLYLE